MNLKIYGGPKDGGWRAHGEYEPGVDLPLGPCRFCGGDLSLDLSNSHTLCYNVTCEDCYAQGPHCGDSDLITRRTSKKEVERLHRAAFDEALEAWNEWGRE